MERWEELIQEASEDEVKAFLVDLIKRSPGLADSVIMEFCDEEDLDQELINKISNNYRKLYDRYYNLGDKTSSDQARAYTQRLDVFIITEIQPLIFKGLIDGAFRVAREVYETNSESIPVSTAFGHKEKIEVMLKDLMTNILENSDEKQREAVYKWLLERQTDDNSSFGNVLINEILDEFIAKSR